MSWAIDEAFWIENLDFRDFVPKVFRQPCGHSGGRVLFAVFHSGEVSRIRADGPGDFRQSLATLEPDGLDG
jgi:hypothetical protein